MKIKYIKMENSVSEVTETEFTGLVDAHNVLSDMIKKDKSLRKAEKLEKLSAKNLLTLGYAKEFGFDFMYQVQGGYIHVLVKENDVTFLYVSHSGTTYYRTFDLVDYLPKFYLEELSGYEKTAPKGINFLARDGYFYATEFVTVEAKAMSERNN
jgi:hypothetical protein